MKTANRIIILVIVVVILFILFKVTDVLDGFSGENTLTIETTEMDFGHQIFGNKISIRDNIRVRQKGNFTIDRNYLSLGDENKDIEMSFLAELGYKMKDIIGSERVDSLDGEVLLSRTLLVELPLPDTLSFITMDKVEKKNEWFWQGWHRDHINFAARNRFYKELRQKAYVSFRSQQLSPDRTNILSEAAISVLNYVNNAYKIGHDEGFDSIIATFNVEDPISSKKYVVRCNADGYCFFENDLRLDPLQ